MAFRSSLAVSLHPKVTVRCAHAEFENEFRWTGSVRLSSFD